MTQHATDHVHISATGLKACQAEGRRSARKGISDLTVAVVIAAISLVVLFAMFTVDCMSLTESPERVPHPADLLHTF